LIMLKTLRKIYYSMFLPWTLIFAVLYLLNFFNIVTLPVFYAGKPFGIIIFVLAPVLSIAVPVFLRANFAHSIRNLKAISLDKLFGLERNLILVTMITPYLAVVAILFDVPDVYTTGIFLFGLYSIYAYFPTENKIRSEMKIFRVKTSETV